MPLRARLGLIWLGLWSTLTLVGWLLLTLFYAQASIELSFVLAMASAALVTYVLQLFVNLGDILWALFDMGVATVRWLRALTRRA